MRVTPIQTASGMSSNTNDSNSNKSETVEELVHSEEEKSESKRFSNEEAKNLYYAYRASNLMKSKIEIYLDISNEDKDLNYSDIRDFTKLNNKSNILEYYKNEIKIQENDSKYELWA